MEVYHGRPTGRRQDHCDRRGNIQGQGCVFRVHPNGVGRRKGRQERPELRNACSAQPEEKQRCLSVSARRIPAAAVALRRRRDSRVCRSQWTARKSRLLLVRQWLNLNPSSSWPPFEASVQIVARRRGVKALLRDLRASACYAVIAGWPARWPAMTKVG